MPVTATATTVRERERVGQVHSRARAIFGETSSHTGAKSAFAQAKLEYSSSSGSAAHDLYLYTYIYSRSMCLLRFVRNNGTRAIICVSKARLGDWRSDKVRLSMVYIHVRVGNKISRRHRGLLQSIYAQLYGGGFYLLIYLSQKRVTQSIFTGHWSIFDGFRVLVSLNFLRALFLSL